MAKDPKEYKRQYMREYQRKRRRSDPIFREQERKRALAYYWEHREKELKQMALWRQLNKDYFVNYNKEYRVENKERLNKQSSDWYYNNLERSKANDKAKYERDKQKIISRVINYNKERIAKDPVFKLRSRLGTHLSTILKSKKIIKKSHLLDLIGISYQELKQHLESKFYPHPATGEAMTWDNYGKYGWHIDHIIPCASYDLSDPIQLKQCWNWTNLQPLWAIHNLTKNAKKGWKRP